MNPELKALVICGPTSVGKTSISVKIAKKINAEIISADSRQVYSGMDITTGKDISVKNKFILKKKILSKDRILLNSGYKTIDGVKIWLVDAVKPDKPFSVYHYKLLFHEISRDILSRGKKIIISGGTGLYISAIEKNIDTLNIPVDVFLRKKLDGLHLEELQEILKDADNDKFLHMNHSDVNNPRRLIRAIEVSAYYKKFKKFNINENDQNIMFKLLKFGLLIDSESLKEKIYLRLQNRINNGLFEEIRKLKKTGYSKKLKSFSSIGISLFWDYAGIKDYDDISEKEFVNLCKKWINLEFKYAQRQMTWWKKDKNIIWIDNKDPNIMEKIINEANKWYT